MSTIKKLDELGVSPAPWDVCDFVPLHGDGDPCGKWLVDGDGNDLVTELDGDGIDGINANARLISAAPDLYDACCDLLEIVENVFEYVGVDVETIMKIERAKAALAKAGGEEVE